MLKKFLNVGVLALFTLWGCSERNEFPSGYQLLDRSSKGEVREVTLFPVADGEKQYRVEVNAGNRASLFLGSYKDITAWSVLRFTILPDSATVQSAQLILRGLALKGEGESFRTTVHAMTKDWSESSVVWSDVLDGYAVTDIGGVGVPVSDSTDLYIEVDPQTVNSWISSSSANYGILVKHDGASFLREFGSSDSGDSNQWPILKLTYTTGGQPDTTELPASFDATLFQYTGNEALGELLPGNPYLKIGNASGFRTLLRFDFSDIPEQATIHRGVLQLSVNPENSETESEGMSYGIYPIVTNLPWDPQTIKTDSTVQIPIGLATSDIENLGNLELSYASAFARIIQSWTLGTSPNYGLMMRSAEQGRDTSNLSFLTSSQPDSNLMPRLTVTYSLPPTPRFEE